MSNKFKDVEAKYTMIYDNDHVIMQPDGFNHTINPKDASLSNFIFVPEVTNTASLTERFRRWVRTDFMVYKNEHNRLIDAPAATKVQYSSVRPVMYKSSMKEVYKDLYTDNQTRANAFILKIPSSSPQAEKITTFIKKCTEF
jgi:hypothetical protein